MHDVLVVRTALLSHLDRVGIKVPSAWLWRSGSASGVPLLASCTESDDPVMAACVLAEREMDQLR